jgi:hypothetical protein
MNKSFKYNEHLEKVLTALFGLIGMVAIFVNLHLKGYSNENWLDAIKDVAGLIVVLAVFIASVRISRQSKTFTDVAKSELEKLQVKYDDFLMGPRYNRDNYDPEKGQGLEYLFVTNDKKKSTLRAKFIPIQPLEEGILTIYVQPATLADALNYGRGNVTDDDIKKIKKEVKDSLTNRLENKFKGDFEIIDDSKDSAIIIDFNEQKMGKKKFAKAISECTEVAVLKLKSFRKNGIS